MQIQDNTKLIRGHAAGVCYTGGDEEFVTRINQPLVDRMIAIKRMREDEAAADRVRAAN